MLTFLSGLLRVAIGFVLASAAAGAVQVLFAVTPAELIDASQASWSAGGLWILETATIIGIFALPFAVLSAIISEWRGIRSFAYHGLVGIAVAVADRIRYPLVIFGFAELGIGICCPHG